MEVEAGGPSPEVEEAGQAWDSTHASLKSTFSLQQQGTMQDASTVQASGQSTNQSMKSCHDILTGSPISRYNHKRFFRSKQVVYILFLNFLVGSVLRITTSFFLVTDTMFVFVASGIKLGITLTYPIAGFCGDVYFGRKRMVLFSLPVVIIGFVMWLIFVVINRILFETILEKQSLIFAFVTIPSLLPVHLGIASFKANVLQFGADQLITASSDNISSFVGWFVITKTLSMVVPALFAYLSQHCSYNYGLAFVALGLSATVVLCVSDWNCIRKHFKFHDNPLTGIANPYKTIRDVCTFARQHKYPVRRSALTYWEDELPSRLDLAKARYGGPFTYEEVENVKTFFRVLSLVVVMDLPHILDAVTFRQVDLLATHVTPNLTCRHYLKEQFFVYECYASQLFFGSYFSIFLVVIVFLLAYELLLQPCYHRYIPGILKRYAVGAFILVLASFSDFLIDLVGHLKEEETVPCMFRTICVQTTGSDDVLSSLNVSTYFLILPGVMVAVGYGLIEMSTIEFILAQTPYSMIGVAIGIHFSMKTVYHLVGLCLITIFTYTDALLVSYCGRVYYAMNTTIGALGFVAFCVLARRYKYRKRDEPGDDHVYQFAEEYWKLKLAS